MLAARGCGKGNGEMLINGRNVSVKEDEEALEIGSITTVKNTVLYT